MSEYDQAIEDLKSSVLRSQIILARMQGNIDDLKKTLESIKNEV